MASPGDVPVTASGVAFHDRLRLAISERGLTLDSVRRRLMMQNVEVGRSTLSVWQNGRRHPTGAESARVVAALERVLDLPARSLLDLLDAAPESPAEPPPVNASVRLPFDDLIERIGCRGVMGHFDLRVGLTRLRVSQYGAIESIESEIVGRTRVATDRIAVTYGTEIGGDLDLVRLRVIAGGTLGRVATSPEVGLIAAEILLDAPIDRGGTVRVRHHISDANTMPSTEFRKVIVRPSVASSIEATFHPAKLPVQVVEYERTHEDGPETYTRALTLGANWRATAVRQPARPRIFGLRWTFHD